MKRGGGSFRTVRKIGIFSLDTDKMCDKGPHSDMSELFRGSRIGPETYVLSCDKECFRGERELEQTHLAAMADLDVESLERQSTDPIVQYDFAGNTDSSVESSDIFQRVQTHAKQFTGSATRLSNTKGSLIESDKTPFNRYQLSDGAQATEQEAEQAAQQAVQQQAVQQQAMQQQAMQQAAQ